jgi:chorismate mutase
MKMLNTLIKNKSKKKIKEKELCMHLKLLFHVIYTVTLDLCKIFRSAIIKKEKNGWKHNFSGSELLEVKVIQITAHFSFLYIHY